ncbi:hypothetical protein [Novibacillus thermophilus]|uniref:hypothetical protein n=1 Tax=Novibacillus thermophilus TaxID=1471761 RepID=UPI0014731536|nr:hypothetical protein [Novibacillus thermophilus]
MFLLIIISRSQRKILNAEAEVIVNEVIEKATVSQWKFDDFMSSSKDAVHYLLRI